MVSSNSIESTAAKPATAGAELTARARFQRAAHCQPVDRPPVWLMRQAGRALPEYRKLKETHTFVELVQSPELAVEVTLQPVRRFGFDAAILFSDILVIPEAMGQTYRFRETGGVIMDFAVTSLDDIKKLSTSAIRERLNYVNHALRILRRELGDSRALIGFSGSPWTLATFMMEGASVPKYGRALKLFREARPAYDALAEKLTEDWECSLAEVREKVPAHIGLQGNLSPELLSEATEEDVIRETQKTLEIMRGRPGHIFNLGHGVTPKAKLENIAALVATVKGFR